MYGKERPRHYPGEWTVAVVRPSGYEKMVDWMTKEAAEWWFDYYSTMYTNMRFTLLTTEKADGSN